MLSYYGRVDESKLSNDRGDRECTVILDTIDNKVSKAHGRTIGVERSMGT